MTADILRDYIAGRLDDSERRRVERAIREDRDTANSLAEVRRTTELVQTTFMQTPDFMQAPEFPRGWLELLKQEPKLLVDVTAHRSDRTKTWL